MSDKDTCCCSSIKTLALACSGGSNAGQIANNIMIELDKKGLANAFCLAGVGADLSGFIESSKAARLVVIDGCPVACGKKALEKHGIVPENYYVVTDLGIEKKHAFDQLPAETGKVLSAVLAQFDNDTKPE
jgi:uncharacterized metal-binding protein